MTSFLATETAALRSASLEGVGSGAGRKSPRAAKKPSADPGRRLLSELDIEDALRWRFSGLSAAEIAAVADQLRPFAEDFRDARPEVAAVLAALRRPSDRRSPWSLACAVLADDAARQGDITGYWAAGIEVVSAFRQSRRGSHGNHVQAPTEDALDALIKDYLEVDPDYVAGTLFNDFAAMAGGHHRVLADFDEDGDELVCQLVHDDIRLANVGRDEFARRLQKVRARADQP
ncbi:MAG: hypothetical protein IPM03_08300 [Sulfuritalea sp.]|nr:hypothetical protein [Sulfuritalea sp.]